jgi:hypothetical protein
MQLFQFNFPTPDKDRRHPDKYSDNTPYTSSHRLFCLNRHAHVLLSLFLLPSRVGTDAGLLAKSKCTGRREFRVLITAVQDRSHKRGSESQVRSVSSGRLHALTACAVVAARGGGGPAFTDCLPACLPACLSFADSSTSFSCHLISPQPPSRRPLCLATTLP